jgi:hypothetical protein
MGTGFFAGKAAGAWSYSPHLVPRLRMCGAIPLLPHTYVFMASYEVKHSENFTFTSTSINLVARGSWKALGQRVAPCYWSENGRWVWTPEGHTWQCCVSYIVSLESTAQSGLENLALEPEGSLPCSQERLWREADHSPPSSADVKEWVELYIRSPNTPSWRGA